MFNILVSTTKARLALEASLRPFQRSTHCTDTYVDVYHELDRQGFIEIVALESSRFQTDRFDIAFNVIGA